MKRRLLLAGLLLPGLAHAQGFSESQRAEIERIIAELLKRDPKILRDALAALEADDARAQAAAAQGAIAMNRDMLERNPADPVLGNPQGSLTIVEFSDYRCPYCRRSHPDVRRLLAEDSSLRLVAKELPILGPGSVVMARAALAAQRQGKWQAANDRLIAFQGEPTEAAVVGTLVAIGLDEAKLRRDMDSDRVSDHIARSFMLADHMSLIGTPTLIAGDEGVFGDQSLKDLQDLVARARATMGVAAG